MLRTAGHGAHLLAAISKAPKQFVGYAFFDDTDLPTLNMSDIRITAAEVMEDMQESINRWEGGLKVTGGAIAPEKVGCILFILTLMRKETGHMHNRKRLTSSSQSKTTTMRSNHYGRKDHTIVQKP
mmetsp:Transcript_3738/g.4406  ORF Transcript_3738/g.4406 Transcript_3738/m.4406 type:complete len:126 (+) Transcript_3738:998-1375(+)